MSLSPPRPSPQSQSQSGPRLTDRAALLRARRRVQPDALFLHRLARDGIEERLAMVNRPLTDAAVITGHPEAWAELVPGARLVCDDERLDLGEASCDLVVHAMALHWADDPVGQLVQCRRALRPDGLMLAVFPAGQTLQELRAALAGAESAIRGRGCRRGCCPWAICAIWAVCCNVPGWRCRWPTASVIRCNIARCCI